MMPPVKGKEEEGGGKKGKEGENGVAIFLPFFPPPSSFND
jgi:hypothetical protein